MQEDVFQSDALERFRPVGKTKKYVGFFETQSQFAGCQKSDKNH
jgi:hypothetical protein